MTDTKISKERLAEIARGVWTGGSYATLDEQQAMAALILASRHQEPVEPADTNGFGWVFWSPDSGEEYSLAHPIESGECPDAERIRSSTSQEDVLYEAMQGHFQALRAASIPKPGVKVKPLEWWENDPAPAGANVYSYIGECTSLVGFYRIGKAADRWVLRFNGGVISRGLASLEEAKAAAQSDYEQRIRSALEPQPAPVVTDNMVERARSVIIHEVGVEAPSQYAVRAALTAALQKQESGE